MGEAKRRAVLLQRDPPFVDPAWQKQLDAMVPRTEGASWLKLVWVAGETWEPVERWCVYQMMPRAVMLSASEFMRNIVEWLEGPNPRTMGRMVGGEWDSWAPPISQLQWKLYQEHRCYGRKLWVVQGPHGGHKAEYNNLEKKLMRLENVDWRPPVIGDLDFAEPNARTFELLRLCLDMREEERAYAEITEGGQVLSEESEAAVRHGRERIWKWIEAQSEGMADQMAYMARDSFYDTPQSPRGLMSLDAQEERLKEKFITEGA